MNDMNFAYVSGYITEEGIIEVERNSGVIDKIPFEKEDCDISSEQMVTLKGRLVTQNFRDGGDKTHKKTYIKVESATFDESYPKNEMDFTGTLVKKYPIRVTPFGKTIIDVIVAINNGIESYYPSVIAWGTAAERMQDVPVGTKLHIQGRFQSREYLKELPERSEYRTAYEISAKSVKVL